MDDTPRLEGAVDLRIGQMEGEAPYLFGRLTDVALDTAGRIYVADMQTHDVRIFDASGSYMATAGREGQGPGEFWFPDRPCEITIGPENRLWATGFRRLEIFRLQGDQAEHEESISLPRTTACEPVMRIDSTGFTVVSVREESAGGYWQSQDRMSRGGERSSSLRLPDRVPGDSLGWVPITRSWGRGEQTIPAIPPFPAHWVLRHAPDGRHAEAVTSRYHVELFDRRGRMTTAIEGPQPGPRVTPHEQDSAQDTLAAIARSWDTSQMVSADPYPDFQIPDRKNPLRNLWFDTEGRLWVQVWTHRSRGENEAHVYAEDGTLLFTATWPIGVDLSYGAIRGRTALGTTTDGVGVERVVRIQFAPVEDA